MWKAFEVKSKRKLHIVKELMNNTNAKKSVKKLRSERLTKRLNLYRQTRKCTKKERPASTGAWTTYIGMQRPRRICTNKEAE